ncbi:hypothetical protein S245_009501 [Arachis hypogaea]
MSYCGNSHGGDGAEIPLSDTSLLTLCGIPTKIDSDRKRTKSLVVLVEQKEKHNQHLEQTNKMSCCRSSDGRDGDEEQMSVDMVDYVVNEHHINVDSEMIKGVQPRDAGDAERLRSLLRASHAHEERYPSGLLQGN